LTSSGSAVPFSFVGEFGTGADGGSLVFMRAREYSPALGRFLSQDPAGQGQNLYEYAANMPGTLIDPSGECFILGPFENGGPNNFLGFHLGVSKGVSVGASAGGNLGVSAGWGAGTTGVGVQGPGFGANVGVSAGVSSGVGVGYSRGSTYGFGFGFGWGDGCPPDEPPPPPRTPPPPPPAPPTPPSPPVPYGNQPVDT
jgi:RHS repeat-associated protein